MDGTKFPERETTKMSDETTDSADVEVSDFQPITSQDALDKIIGQRIDRVKRQFAGYDELKAKASQFDEMQEASKTELQKLQERADVLERELKEERDRAGRASVAAAKGVPASALTGSTVEEWEASADSLLEWREQEEQRKAPPKPARGLKSGASPAETILDPKERAAQAIRALRNQN